MTASLTRSHLAPLEGQLVFATGRPKEWKHRGDFDDILLVGVKLWRWDGKSAVNTALPPDTTADHTWIRCEPHAIQTKLLHPTICIGRVAYYTRSDGTFDLGLQTLPCIDLDSLLAEAWSHYQDRHKHGTDASRKTLHLLRLALTCAHYQGQSGYAFSQTKSIPQALEILLPRIEKLDRDIEADESRRLTSALHSHGPCSGLNPLQLPPKHRPKPTGF